MFSELFPILSTPDLERALRFYRDLLGMAVTHRFDGPDGEPAYVGLHLGASQLGIGRDSIVELPAGRRPIALWVYADDCDAAIERMRAAAVEIVEEPVDQPWGERVARVHDPDGNLVIVGAAPAARSGLP